MPKMKLKLCPKKLGREVETLRGEMSLERLSSESGLSVEYLRNLEAGEAVKVKKKELKCLSRALQMPVPCIRIMGMEPADVPDKVMSKLAGSVQDAIRTIIKIQQEDNKGEAETNKPKKGKKKK